MKKQYFISLIPPSPLKERIHELKLEFRDRFNSSHSLNAPPHITLVRPFHMEEEEEGRMNARLSEFSGPMEPFGVHLNGFSSFPAGVIYIVVEESDPLFRLQERLEEMALADETVSISRSRHSFHPHLTLASKDLSGSDFRRAREEFEQRDFDGSFTADRLSLLKHDGRRWEVAEEFLF